MKPILTNLMILAALGGPFGAAPARGQQPSPAQVIVQGQISEPVLSSAAEEVVQDVIVRDKRGRPLKDLKLDEVKVSDDGASQKVTGLRLVDGQEVMENGVRAPLDPMKAIRLVTLVFERLGNSARRVAKDAAESLVKGEQAQNVYFAVVAIDSQLFVLQEFTTDKAALKKAIEKATSGQYATYAEDSERIKKSLRAAAGSADTAPVPKKTAQVLLDMLEFNSSFGREESTRMTIFSTLSLVRGQYSMPGRKSLVYFSEGLEVPTHLDEPFRSIPSVANRYNVAIYTVDARGVQTSSQNAGTKDLAKAARLTGVATMSTQTAGAENVTNPAESTTASTPSAEGAVTKDELRASDLAESSMRMNVQLPLQTLAESTGAFLISDSNDLSKPMRQVSEEISTYYEVQYHPGIASYDGRFRKTQVEVARKDTVVHARAGYFAMAMNVRGPVLLPYEYALAKALELNPMPKDVEFRSAAMVVRPGTSEAKGLVIVEVPMSGIHFSEHLDNRTFTSRVSLLVLVKDTKGAVVAKVTSDLPRNGPLAVLPQARAGNYIYTEKLDLPPGRYTLETAVMDHEAGKVGTRKSSYVVTPKAQGVAMSSLYLVRNFQANAKNMDPNEPLQYQGGKITATLSGQVFAVKGAQLSTFFVVYPDPAIAEKPVALVEFSVDGKVIAKSELPLPAADAQGRIPYVLSSPAETMPPATYLIHVTVKQGNSMADGMTQVQIAAR
ncbi:VWA domain-containing protein [uncultured Paludibaculum sp.]|uniref:VWA domain-containing protein n=1 Tax=uncultured Paludibaculum sp. TaxID=1765020 RepID=UPI002AABB283|nr:VWA domain-containing protein [uncultured Paludibaculum sp.]